MNHHLQRFITGIVALPLLIIFISYSSEKSFSFFIFLVIQIAVWEYNRLSFSKNKNLYEKVEVSIFAAAITYSAHSLDFAMILLVLTFSLLISFLIFLLQIKNGKIEVANVEKVVVGFMYIPLMMSSFIFLRNLPGGVKWVLLTLAIAVCGDIFGFYVGRTIGKRKLYPSVSPNKTVEGTLGVIFGSILSSIVVKYLFFTELPVIHAFVLGAAGGIMGQLGDLFESALKRAAGVKDAGLILPGHGGILDRLDSLSFIAPFVFYYQHLVAK